MLYNIRLLYYLCENEMVNTYKYPHGWSSSAHNKHMHTAHGSSFVRRIHNTYIDEDRLMRVHAQKSGRFLHDHRMCSFTRTRGFVRV